MRPHLDFGFTGWTVLIGLGLGFAGMLAGALAANPWIFLAAAVLCYAMDIRLQGGHPATANLLSQLRAGITSRALIRQLLLLGLLAGLSPTTGFWWSLVCIVILFTLQFLYGGIARRLRALRRLPVITRNIGLDALAIPNSPPSLLVNNAMARLLLLDAALLFGGAAAVAASSITPVLIGGAVSIAATLSALAAVLAHFLRARRIPGAEAVMGHVQEWIDGYRPEVVLYFTGSADSAYQANMWLESIERLPERSIIVLRERAIAAQLAATPVPVLCVPAATDLMALDFGPARVALYPANTGKNIHMLRNPLLQHVFIGHGDSDKIASINPFSKVYDEVWTAGKAGRDRYSTAQVGVRDDEIVEVGRPQLTEIRTDTAPHTVPTVLYAPTWEGWTDDPGNTSLITAGPALIARLLAAEPRVRVLYKPHPFTGIRDPRARKAHLRIIAMLAAADRGRPTGKAPARLAELDRRLAAADSVDTTVDEAQRSRDAGGADPAAAARVRALSAEWHRIYWEHRTDHEHLVIEGPRPHLYSCFNQADLLISDISSVVADFIASGKPYAITNCEGTGDEEFRTEHPSCGAAFLLGEDGCGLEEALQALRDPAADRFAHARRELKTYLLGPEEPDAQSRFGAAVADLYRRAAAKRPVVDGAAASAAAVPGADGAVGPVTGAVTDRAGTAKTAVPLARRNERSEADGHTAVSGTAPGTEEPCLDEKNSAAVQEGPL
ncbi:MAG: glycerophosphotransferase [Nocardiopsaceae bacterium]|nr:glycerophosphotransferase [Nocardiopsaceae bacterium]